MVSDGGGGPLVGLEIEAVSAGERSSAFIYCPDDEEVSLPLPLVPKYAPIATAPEAIIKNRTQYIQLL